MHLVRAERYCAYFFLGRENKTNQKRTKTKTKQKNKTKITCTRPGSKSKFYTQGEEGEFGHGVATW